MSLPVRLRELRVKKNQSLQDVANAVGASKGYIWELESGKPSNPSLELLKRIADHFGVSVAYLIGESVDANPGLVEMYRQLEALDPGARELIKKVMESLKKPPEK